MTIILIISKLTYRKANIKNMLIISLFLTLINNPYAIYSVSLQLSYLGTIGVITISPIISNLFTNYKVNKKLANILSVPIAAQIAIAPIMIINFNTISLTFLISNIIAIPLLGISIIGGFIFLIISFVLPLAANKLSFILNIFLKLLIDTAKITSNFKLSTIYIVTPTFFTAVLYYLSVFLTIYKLKANNKLLNTYFKKIILLFLIIIIIIEFPYSNYNKNLKIYFIDVGQRR